MNDKNAVMNELEDAVMRQAISMGLQFGTDEFTEFILERIIRPEWKMHKHLTGKKKSPIRTDTYVSGLEDKWLYRGFIESLVKWSKRNKGLSILQAERILNIDQDQLRVYGKDSKRLTGTDFIEYLDGSEAFVLQHSHLPQFMSNGCRNSCK